MKKIKAMSKILGFYAFIQLGFIIFVAITFFIWDKRYRKNHGISIPMGFEKTEEVSIDPNSGEVYRVYNNPSTGERFYHKEDNAEQTPQKKLP